LAGKALRPGRYLIRWSVTSADGHVIVGATSFAYKTATPKSKLLPVVLRPLTGTQAPKVSATLSGSRPGARTFTLNGVTGEATVELRNLRFGAPLVWKLRTQRASLVGNGVLPSAGTWEITVKVRVSAFEQLTYTSKVNVNP
jgi:uncharacterized protein with von Willebrand factor type A (vWA) domain